MPSYYEMLGVQSTASHNEIRSAYRNLISKIHPDLNGGNKQFETLAQQVNAAYEVLSDPKERAAYDWEQGIRTPGPNGAGTKSHYGRYQGNNWSGVEEVEFDISLDFVEHGYRDLVNGVWIDIPPGVEDGERIPTVIEGREVILIIRVEPDDKFTRRGANLYAKLSIRRVDALTRKSVEVSTLSSWADFDLKPEVLQGERICLTGHGLPFRHNPRQRGDLYVECEVKPAPERRVEVTLMEVDQGCYRRLDDFGDVEIPPGVATGERIYVWNRFGKEALLLIGVTPDARFARSGDDLAITVHVGYAAMLMRLNYDLVMFGLREIKIRTRPEYADGRRVRLSGQGLPNRQNPRQRGDLYVTFSTTPWKLPDQEPTSRLDRTANFLHKSTIRALNAIGKANEVAQKAVAGYQKCAAALERNWDVVRIALIALAVLAGLALLGWVVYFIIVNIVTILIAVAVCGVVALLFYRWLRSL